MDARELARQIEEARRRIEPLVKDIDPQDLVNILHALLRPFPCDRSFLLRPLRPGVYVF